MTSDHPALTEETVDSIVYQETNRDWLSWRNWRLWAAMSMFFLVLTTAFALVTTTIDRNSKNDQLSDIQHEQACRAKAANAVNVALTSKVISLGEVDEQVGQFVVQLSQDRSQIPKVVIALGDAIAKSKATGQALANAVSAQAAAIEACKEAKP